MELNKIFAAVLLAGVIAMTTGFLADLLVAPEELEENAYVVDLGEETQVADGAAAEEEGIPDIATLLADADPAAGEGAFRACAACHTYEKGGPNRVGPNLWGVVGGPMAHIEDFNYSDALMERAQEGGEWTWENLNGFIHAPREWLPGTAMSYAGLKNDQDRANLLAWMNQQSDNPIPLPEPAAAEETAEAPAEDAAAEGEAAETAAAEPAAEGEAVSEMEAAAEEDMVDAESTPSTGDEAAVTGTEQTSAAEPADAETVAAEEVPTPATDTGAAQAEEEVATEETPAAAEPVEDAQPLEIAQAEEPAAEDAASEEPATEEAATEEPAAEEGGASGFVAQVAAADPSAGQGVARACMACHTFEQGGGNRVGPNLWDVVGNDIAAAEGFRYSQAMQDFGTEHGQWSIELLGDYLAAPREVVPGTNMAYAGVRSEEDLAALVAWMRTLSENPVPLQ